MSETAPLLLALGLFLGSFVLEDAAFASGLALVAAGALSPLLALAALLAGILTGDLGLYAIGRWARGTRRFARLAAKPGVARFLAAPPRRLWLALIAARFVPGMRLPVYFGSGLIGARALPTALALAAANCLWIVPILVVRRVL